MVSSLLFRGAAPGTLTGGGPTNCIGRRSTGPICAVLFPMAIRGFAMGLAVFSLWTVNAAISFLFPILNDALGSTGTFSLFVAVNIVSFLFVRRFVPETKGLSLEELEVRFRTEGEAARVA